MTVSKYHVKLTAVAFVKGSVEVEADSRQDAEVEAINRIDEVSWIYDGINDNFEPEVDTVERLTGPEPLKHSLITADEEGWSEGTLIRVMAEFIAAHADKDTYAAFLKEKAR